MPLTGIDDAWQSRLPQGWTTLPDGSVGPSNGLPDWLKQLIPSPGAATPNAPGLPSGAGPQGLMPGGGALGYQATTPGAPSMGFPAQGGPQVMPPQNSTIPPNKSVGPFTGGTSTENAWDPRSWFRANPGATFQQGQPMGPDVTGGAASFNPMSLLGSGNPAWRAAIAAGGVLSPTPADTGELKPSQAIGFHSGHPDAGQTPYDPLSSVRVSPTYAPAVPPSRPSDAPPGNPSATPRPTPYPPKRPKNLGATAAAPPSSPSSNPRFGLYQPQVPGSGQGGPLSRSPIYTTLNLFGGKS
jgi:hypothetical protein